MIKRISETWKQQKDEVTRRNAPKLKKPSQSLVTRSVIGKSDGSCKSQPIHEENGLPEECIISPPQRLTRNRKKKKDNTISGLSSLDWDASDSILNDISRIAKQNSGPELRVEVKSITTLKEIRQKQSEVTDQTSTPVNSTASQITRARKGNSKNSNNVYKKKPGSSQESSKKRKSRDDEEFTETAKRRSTEDENQFSCGSSSVNRTKLSSNGTQLSSSFCEKLELSAWGLPDTVLRKYKKHGIEKMFPWQLQCLMTGKALDGGNLVYSAPTSAGKTLVAEILMMKRVLETKKKAIYILPFVSVAREKMYSLRDLLEDSGIKVGGFMGSEAPPGGFASVNIAVCTIEKANSLVNRLMEENKITSLSCIVIDEMHMIGDKGRGYLLELLLSKIQYLRNPLGNQTEDYIQILGMSATLPNLTMIADWLTSDLYVTTYRPVPLQEHFKIGKTIFDEDGKKVGTIKDLYRGAGDEEDIIPLCLETMQEDKSILIFCPTKNWCEKLSERIAEHISKHPTILSEDGSEGKKIFQQDKVEAVLEQLRRCPVGLEKGIEKVISHGVAFHHAGLTFDERDIIEGSFRRGVLRVLIATSTLSSGVNLPARRVIIRTPIFGGKLLDPLIYKQMAGRAGRKGVDSRGESILICKGSEKQKAMSLLNSHLKPVYSCLLDGNESKQNTTSMKRALLEVIAAGVAVTPSDVERYAKSSYLHVCLEVLTGVNADDAIASTMKFLLDNEFITVKSKDNAKGNSPSKGEEYFATQLGSATLASSLSPDEALIVFSELQRARQSFVLESELHMIYQVTPVYIQEQWPDLDWFVYFRLWERLPYQYKLTAERVGVSEGFLTKALRNRIQTKTDEQRRSIRIHRRFYAALVLQDLVNEVPLPLISRKYSINRGLLQSLQNSSSVFAGMVTVFCNRLGWTGLELLLEQFQSRLSFGVTRELCNLVRIPLLNGCQARFLYSKGYKTVSCLVNAKHEDIAKVLRDSVPFESSKKAFKQSNYKSSRYIWLNGKEGLTEHEAASLIIAEAKRILAVDAAVLGISIETAIEKSNEINNLGKIKKNRKSLSHKRSVVTNDSSIVKLSNTSIKKTRKLAPKKKKLLMPSGKELTRMSSGDKSKQIKETCSENPKHNEIKAETTPNHIVGVPLHPETPPDILFQPLSSWGSELQREKKTIRKKSPKLLDVRHETAKDKDEEAATQEQKLLALDSPYSTFSDFSLRLSGSEENLMNLSPVKLENHFQDNSIEKENIARDKNKKNDNYEGLLTDSIDISDSMFSDTRNNDQGNGSQIIRNSDVVPRKSSIGSLSQSDEFVIIDVTTNKDLFLTFLQEWRHQMMFSFCFALQKVPMKSSTIGANIKAKKESVTLPRCAFTNDHIRVIGLALCWGGKDAYYVHLEDMQSFQTSSHSLNMLSIDFLIESITSVFNQIEKKNIVAYNMKSHLKLLFSISHTMLENHVILDPQVGQWMIDPDDKPYTFYETSRQYLKGDSIAMAEAAGTNLGTMCPEVASYSGRSRACVESVLVYQIMKEMEEKLANEELYVPFLELEMPSVRLLAIIELNGIPFSDDQCEKLKLKLKEKVQTIESECYRLANRRFSLKSPDDIAKVLFHELCLPPNGDLTTTTLVRSTRAKVKGLSTSKAVLEKLTHMHELPELILEWRRINSALSKILIPIQRQKIHKNSLGMERIYSESQFHTSTGRIAFSEPNLQNVPKDFVIKDLSNENVTVSLRSMFVTQKNYTFIAADYSQLELRLIAHLSQDKKLLDILNSDGDIFKCIAAELNSVDISSVTQTQRQHAKQICYGILYGIGTKALAEQLALSEEDAALYMEKFKDRYTGVKLFILTTVKDARVTEYVTTICGRKRYLPKINSNNVTERSHAERQAVNTTVQGSAADLVKKATIMINEKIKEIFGETCLSSSKENKGAFIVLQIHDELLYEVCVENVDIVEDLIKTCMENALKLSVKMPVKVRKGDTWGNLIDA